MVILVLMHPFTKRAKNSSPTKAGIFKTVIKLSVFVLDSARKARR